jgi:hypothetical protein
LDDTVSQLDVLLLSRHLAEGTADGVQEAALADAFVGRLLEDVDLRDVVLLADCHLSETLEVVLLVAVQGAFVIGALELAEATEVLL